VHLQVAGVVLQRELKSAVRSIRNETHAAPLDHEASDNINYLEAEVHVQVAGVIFQRAVNKAVSRMHHISNAEAPRSRAILTWKLKCTSGLLVSPLLQN
jgi:hypothetical protein